MDRDIAAYYISGKEIVKRVMESLDFSQDIFVLVERFNNQREQVAIASKAGEIAGRRYYRYLISMIHRSGIMNHVAIISISYSSTGTIIISSAASLSLTHVQGDLSHRK